ncbi:MAG: hypothetical protein JRJ56_00110 [Deltaproteobacteria bacterium]|nr:hypothetical protein [Deltaproteobacteria bacterium]
MAKENSSRPHGKQDLELRRLKRIEMLIGAILLVLVAAAFLMKKPFFRPFDVLAGGVVAYLYFHFLAKTMYGAFYAPEDDREEINISPHLLFKIIILTLVSVVVTLLLLVPMGREVGLCRPVGYLVGFSAMFMAILGDGVFTGLFGTLKPKE